MTWTVLFQNLEIYDPSAKSRNTRPSTCLSTGRPDALSALSGRGRVVVRTLRARGEEAHSLLA